MVYNNILLEMHGRVALVTLNRPKVLNALNDDLINELNAVLDRLETDPELRVLVIAGTEKAFAAGADIGAMANLGFAQAYNSNLISRNWDRINRCRKPVIAAVSGFALGGGCELAMACDFIIAAENAHFSQPEIKVGIMPGAGGTQRLTRVVGKSKAMDMCLTGRMMDAVEAERSGLVSRVVPTDRLIDEALGVAQAIALQSLPVVMMIKESVNRAYETSLSEGMLFERRVFHSAFALEDKIEGMSAFMEKRKPDFKDC